MSIQRLDARHADEAAATLGEAFFDDPLLQVVASDEAARRRWGDWFTDDMSAVAVWVPPDSGEMSLTVMSSDIKVSWCRVPPSLVGPSKGWIPNRRVAGRRRAIRRRHRRDPTEPVEKMVRTPSDSDVHSSTCAPVIAHQRRPGGRAKTG